MNFEWIEIKVTANSAKHGVSFEEAVSVFGDPLAATISDLGHSVGEGVLRVLGRSPSGAMFWHDLTSAG